MLDTSTSISNSAVFLHTVLYPLKQSRLDFTNPKQTFVRIQSFEIDWGRSHFLDISYAKPKQNFWHSLRILLLIENIRVVNISWSI